MGLHCMEQPTLLSPGESWFRHLKWLCLRRSRFGYGVDGDRFLHGIILECAVTGFGGIFRREHFIGEEAGGVCGFNEYAFRSRLRKMAAVRTGRSRRRELLKLTGDARGDAENAEHLVDAMRF
ncbi:MAG: hypothetical protein KGN79_00140 [Acidobacteriota bacterium]|nr:hypothetical protein [Acidobacteriota bacterium]